MNETQKKPKMKKNSPLASLPDRANEKFLSIARSAGKAVRLIQSGTMGSLSKIERGLSREKKKVKSEQTDPAREAKESAATDKKPEVNGLSQKKKEEISEQTGPARETKESAATDKKPEVNELSTDKKEEISEKLDRARETKESMLRKIKESVLKDEKPEVKGLSGEKKEEISEQTGQTEEIKESAPSDETPEDNGSSQTGGTNESEVE